MDSKSLAEVLIARQLRVFHFTELKELRLFHCTTQQSYKEQTRLSCGTVGYMNRMKVVTLTPTLKFDMRRLICVYVRERFLVLDTFKILI
jgi:hypothetical protein